MKKLILAAGALVLAATSFQPASASVGSIAGYVAPAAHGAAENVVKATYGYRVPLNHVLYKLGKKGFWGFKNIKWLPNAYVITARGYGGKLLRIKVNAYNGNIIDIDRINYRKFNYGWKGWSY